MPGFGSSILVLLDVQLKSGDYESNITIKGKIGEIISYTMTN